MMVRHALLLFTALVAMVSLPVEVTSVDAVYFDGSSKPLERNTWKAGKAGEMSLSFKTSEKRGILIYQGGHEGNGHFFSLGLDKGVVQLVVSLGGDNLKFADTVPTNDCEWHRVEVIRDGKGSGDLMVDERKVALSFNDQEGNFHMNGSFLVGGVTSETKDFVLELFGSSYIGCMGGISLLGEPISLSEGDRIGCPDDFNCQSSVITESGEGPCPSDDDDCHSGSGETDEPVTVSTHTTTGSPSVKIITSRMPKTTEPPNLPESPCDEDDEDCPTMSGSGTDESSFAPGTDEPSFASGTDEPSVTTDEPSVTSRPPMPVVFTKGGNIIYKPDDPVQMPNPLEVKLKFSTQQIMASIMYFKVSESEGLQVYLKEGRVTLKYFENIKGRNRRQASPDTSVFLTGKVNDGKPHYISSSISGSTVVTSLDGGKEMVVNHGFSMPSTYESINVGGSSVPQMPGFQGQMESAKAGDMDILAEAAGDNQNVIVNGPVRFVGSVPTPTQKTTTASSKPGKVMTPKPTVTDKSETPSREATTSPEASTTKAGADGTFVIERTTPPQTTTDKDINFPVADSGSSGISGGVVAGVILGVVIAVLVVTALLVFVIMRYQRKDEGSYTLDEQSPSKNGFPNSTKAQEAAPASEGRPSKSSVRRDPSKKSPLVEEERSADAPTLSEPGAAEEEQVSNTQEIETLDRRSSTQVDTSSLSSELSSLHYEESDLYSLSSELEVAEESVVKDEEKLRQVLPDAIASRDALASVNRIAGELRGDPEMWELEEELKRILEEAA